MATTRNPSSPWASRREALVRAWRDTVSELRKVAWPTRPETTNLTLVVIGVSAVLGLFLGGIDVLMTSAFEWLTAVARGFGG
jgi:preprotein translocase SecE subunit